MGSSPRDKHIFISYAHDDADQLASDIEHSLKEYGYDVFLDRESIQGGELWIKSIENAVMNSTHFIAILTPSSIGSIWCGREYQLAMQNNIKVIPLLAKDCIVPGFLSNLQFIDFRSASNSYQKSIEKLINAINYHQVSSSSPNPAWRNLPIKRFAVHRQTHTVACIAKSKSIAEAYLMLDDANYRFRHLLVTETGQIGEKLLGLVSLRQMLKAAARPNFDTRRSSVSDIMDKFTATNEPEPTFACLYEDDTVEMALRKLVQPLAKDKAVRHYFYMSAIPMLDKDEHAVGIVSFKDILRAMLEQKEIPIPKGTVGQFMRPYNQFSISTPDEMVADAKVGMRPIGQRDVPVVESYTNRRLLGLVPDHIFIVNYYTGKTVGEIMTVFADLKPQTEKTSISDMLKIYYDESKLYYSFVVTNSVHDAEYPKLAGMIGYREIFEAMLA